MATSKGGSSSDLLLNVTENKELPESTADEGKLRPKCQIKLTEKGKGYQIELLQRNRSIAHGKLLVNIKGVNGMLNDGASIEKLEQARDALDLEMENFGEAHSKYNCMLSSQKTKINPTNGLTLEIENTIDVDLRRVKAVETAAKLEVEMKFLDQETELKRLQILKQIEMANAEERAMLKIQEEEVAIPSYDDINKNIDKVVPGNFSSDLKTCPVTNNQVEQSEATSPLTSTHLSDVTLQEMIKLQIKQTELSAMIAEQQRMQSLPVQEPPTFNGNSFDYPVFMRAFETIIENKVPGDKERLYFLNKYTIGKANEIIKAYVTLNSDNAYKSKLKAWAPVNEGDSKGLQELSDFLLRCEEDMKTMKFMDDLNCTETLKQISAKLPSYSGMKWCRHAFELRKKTSALVQFHDLVLFVRDEAELATDPAFSPCALKEKRKRESKKEERTRPVKKPLAGGNSLVTYVRRVDKKSSKLHHFSDATNESKRFHVFVANRVQQIQEKTIREQWHYVDTKSNPADDASRGIRMQDLVDDSRWINGPAFLWKDESHWPTAGSEREKGCEIAPDDPEIKKAVSLVTETKVSYPSFLSRLQYFSNWYRAKAAARYLHQVKQRAEVLIIKAVQSEEFGKEIEILTSLKTEQHPNFHERVKHQGRAAVSKCIAGCTVCRKLRGTTQGQKMADLPIDRVEPSPPFTYAAVDYFGPWIIKEKRKELKRYGVLFTCLASRAVHLEIAHSLSTDSFINALRRFVCRRSPVRQLRSDQGTNFVGAKGELKDAISELDHEKISSEMLKHHCDWVVFKMNVPSASHMGGTSTYYLHTAIWLVSKSEKNIFLLLPTRTIWSIRRFTPISAFRFPYINTKEKEISAYRKLFKYLFSLISWFLYGDFLSSRTIKNTKIQLYNSRARRNDSAEWHAEIHHRVIKSRIMTYFNIKDQGDNSLNEITPNYDIGTGYVSTIMFTKT
ncbi:uncharacterized protein LOC110040095, partial [Paramuricea clavata]